MPKREEPGGAVVIGVDVGGTSIKAAVVDPSPEKERHVLGTGKVATDAGDGEEAVLDRIEEVIKNACKDAGVELEDCGAVGVAAAGPVDHLEGVVLKAVNLGWDNYPLASRLRERLGRSAAVENDVRAAVYAEQRVGAAKRKREVFGVWIGTGIGGGLMLDGDLHYGHFRTAGEFGRGFVLPWTPPGEGSLEQVCSRAGMSETILRLLRSNRDSVIEKPENGDPTAIKTKSIAKAYREKDELVTEVIEHAAQVLGVAIGGVVTLLSLECVVLGGGVSDALGEKYVDLVRDSAMKTVFPDEAKAVQIVASGLGSDAGPVGAALLACRRCGVKVG